LRKKPVVKAHTAIYQLCPRSLQELPLAYKGDGSFSNSLIAWEKRMSCYWMIGPWQSHRQNNDVYLLEILEDRHGSRSTIVTSHTCSDQCGMPA